MIVVKINFRENKSEELEFNSKEEMSTYIADNLYKIRDIKILNDGRLMIKFETTDGKNIIRVVKDETMTRTEMIAWAIEEINLEEERIKSINFILPKVKR